MPPGGASSSRQPVTRWRSGSTRSRVPCSSSTHTAPSPTATAAAGPGSATRPATTSPEATGVASVRTVLLVGWDPAASPLGRLPACRRPTTTRATSITTTPAATSHRSRLACFTPTPGHAGDPFGRLSTWRIHRALPSGSSPWVAARRDAGRHGRHPRGAANAALGRAVRARPAAVNRQRPGSPADGLPRLAPRRRLRAARAPPPGRPSAGRAPHRPQPVDG